MSRDAPPTESRFSTLAAVLMALVLVALNAGLWWFANRPNGPEDWHGPIGGFAYSPFQRYQSPLTSDYPSESQVASDLKLLSKYTHRIRLYAMLQNPEVVRLAKKQGLDVLAGAWIDRRMVHNDAEIDALVAQAHRYPKTISRVLVGNEVLLRHDLEPDQLMAYLDRVRAQVHQPVSTAEPWHIWEKYPELVRHVDFITVHLLPYWEGVNRNQAIDNVLGHYETLRRMYPDKHIVVGETGWPSNGDRFEYAKPSTSNEAIYLRRWFQVARALGIDYYVMEAFDQPWKESLGEGRTGAYWGMFSADRTLKFPLTGPITEDTGWPFKALAAGLLALVPMIWFGRRYRRFKLAGRFFFMLLLQLAAGVIVWAATLPFNFYLSPFDWAMLVLLFPAQLAIIAILLINGFEFTEVLWRKRWLRHGE